MWISLPFTLSSNIKQIVKGKAPNKIFTVTFIVGLVLRVTNNPLYNFFLYT